MALLTHSGSNSTDLGVNNTKRLDISDYLLASLVPENNLLGLIDVGPEVGDTAFNWVEDRLNSLTVADASGGSSGMNSVSTTGPTTITLSQADAAILDIGYVLAVETAVTGEQVQVTDLTSTTAVVSRGYGGTTPVQAPASSLLRIINSPTYENSDLGRDMSRARITKVNTIGRFELNVNISMEQIERALAGYAPGVPDELEYQFEQRLREMLRTMNQAILYSRGTDPSTPAVGDYSTTFGLISWLDATFNSTAVPDTTGGAFTDTAINRNNKALYRTGAMTDWIVGGPNITEAIGRLYNDRIRLEQNDRGRGFWAKYFDTSMGNTLRIVQDAAMFDTSGSAICMLLDSGRIRIRPYVNGFFYVIQAPSFRDGDAVRAFSKWGLEMRNTGTDVGQAHVLMTGLTV